MGFLENLAGNASELEIDKAEQEFSNLLAPSEQIEHAYKLIRDVMLFTDKRIIIIDKQGVRGKKTEYHSIPYRNITHFSVETAGTFDLDAELKIWVSGNAEPIQKTFNKQLSIYKVQSVLANYVTG